MNMICRKVSLKESTEKPEKCPACWFNSNQFFFNNKGLESLLQVAETYNSPKSNKRYAYTLFTIRLIPHEHSVNFTVQKLTK